jgi:type III secretory pathway component EscS
MTNTSSPRIRLLLPFTVIGAVGGWMAADFFRFGAIKMGDNGLRLAFVVVTPLCALLLALLVQPTVRWPRALRAFSAASIGVLSAGLVGGALVGVLLWSRWGIVFGAVMGFFCSLAFLPAFGLVLAAARRVGRARPGSLVDRADRRAVWVAVASSVTLGTIAALPDWDISPIGIHPSVEVSRDLGIAAYTVLIALWLGDAFALFRAVRVERQTHAMRQANPDDPRLISSPHKLDLGVGEETVASVLSPAVPYREYGRVLSVIRGNPLEARRALFGTFAMGLAALIVSGVWLAIQIS